MRYTTRLLAVALLAVSLALSGCSRGGAGTDKPPAAKSEAAFPVTVTDDLGHSVKLDAKPQRIVSLAPADTEIVAALGLTGRLVGVTTYDDYPPEVKDLPKVGDFMTPNLEAIAAAKPDLVLVTGGVQKEVVQKLEGLGAKVVAVDPTTIEGTIASIEMVGKATGTSAKAAETAAAIRAEVEDVRAKVAGTKTASCFVEIAQNPVYTAGADTLLDDMIRISNGRNVVTRGGYIGYSLEQLLEDDPQVYLVTKGSMSDPSGLAKRPGYGKLSAVKSGRIVLLDDNLVSRPGPRVAQGLREVAEGLHPEAFK